MTQSRGNQLEGRVHLLNTSGTLAEVGAAGKPIMLPVLVGQREAVAPTG